jgi:hypothetical protein
LYARLTGSRPGKQCLSGARRPNQKDAFGHFAAQSLEVNRVFEELCHFLQIGYCFSSAPNVLKGHPGLFSHNHASFTFTKGENTPH